MTTYELLSICVSLAQTAVLIWYAIETFKLRKSAGKQTDTIGRQYEAKTEQMKILAGQLSTNTS